MNRLAALTLVFLAFGAAPALGAEVQATPASFAATFSAARAGDTIVLADGSYGMFRGAAKPGVVTIKAAPGAAASMSLQFSSAANLVFDGVRFSGIEMAGSTHDITVRNSTITGQTVFRTGELQNADILFDRNVHGAWDKCNGCGEGRVFLPQRTSQPSGITIQNSRFGPGGDSDGIQNGSNGTRILNNEFVGIKQTDVGLAHADSIQLYGSQNTVIRGNFFHDVSNCLMSPDGADHEVFEDNVCVQAVGNGTLGAMQLGSDRGSTIVHNTFYDSGSADCDWNKRCGIMSFGAKSGQPAPSGTVVRDNITAELSQFGTGQSESYNLFTVSRRSGLGDLFGMPTYVGGGRPATYAGFALAPGSRGKNAASDGLDMGARIGVATSGPDPIPTPTPDPTPDPTPAPIPTPDPEPEPAPPVVPPAPAPTSEPALEGPVASYDFDDTGRVVPDRSGHGNDGRRIGGRRTKAGRHGRALAFDGRNDRVTVPESRSLRLTTAMTLEAWVRPTGAGKAARPALRSRGSAYGLYASSHRSSRPAGSVRTRSNVRAEASDRLRANAWTHLASTYDGTALRLYVNGRLVSEKAVSGRLRAGRSPLQIGGDAVLGEFFRGKIDDVRVYDRALSTRDVMADMATGV